MADDPRDPFDGSTVDGRFYDWWKRWDGPPLDEPDERDFLCFLAGAVAAFEALSGPGGRQFAEALTAGAILRREVERRMGDGPVTRG